MVLEWFTRVVGVLDGWVAGSGEGRILEFCVNVEQLLFAFLLFPVGSDSLASGVIIIVYPRSALLLFLMYWLGFG